MLCLEEEEFQLCYKQVLPDTLYTTGLCMKFRRALKRYVVNDARDVYNSQDITRRQFDTMLGLIESRVVANAETNYLLFVIAAGQGATIGGNLVLFTNNFKSSGYYDILNIQEFLHGLAKMYKNLYVIAIAPLQRMQPNL